jgi:hypothetical protein
VAGAAALVAAVGERADEGAVTMSRTLTDADVEAIADAIARRMGAARRRRVLEPVAVLDEVGARRAARAREAAAAEVRRRGQGRRLK